MLHGRPAAHESAQLVGDAPLGRFGWPSEELIPQASNQVLLPVSLESSEESALVLEANQPAFWPLPNTVVESDKTGMNLSKVYGINSCQREKAPDSYCWLEAQPVSADKV